MSEHDSIRFVLDGRVHTVTGIDPTTTVLQYLREHLGRTGTKEGCAEGDCGACTVVLAELRDGRVQYLPINACIRFVATLDGKELITVESLRGTDGRLHPVQQALVDHHGSQCGFCTPGFVMSLLGLYLDGPAQPDRRAIDDALSGNLCRCTGYRPIITAAQHLRDYGTDAVPFAPGQDESARIAQLQGLRPDGTRVLRGDGVTLYAPTDADAFARLYAEHPQATVLAGGTDVGLWINKQFRPIDTFLYLGDVAAFDAIEQDAQGLCIGPAVSLSRAFRALLDAYSALDELHRRFASTPIRNSGTLCGNVANGSPIGDSMPALIALGARVRLRHGDERRELPLDALYLDYMRQDRRPGEFVEAVIVPAPRAGQRFATYKVSKRIDQDISAVCGAYALELAADGRVHDVRIAYGGMAATPKRAAGAEAALRGRPFDEAALADAMRALAGDFTPLTDARASADYRREVAANLLSRFWLEATGVAAPVRLSELA
ncbi:xanthine dehydrogenase small subunit [Plasticicumulans lactativorans]|uniref:Xanthine dehydrogenase small subunit n=1 Tax=Plasticicumulans lactativorans TaxID=1133106 RepID=A0A4R2LG37_9GAMM|nr:xanthine dehydrogenase small subunit [Plasticicumulans lactativorans]TCO81914.1 xanthine dehydrogenase small subunit [Plasticicumulans lactativorans]